MMDDRYVYVFIRQDLPISMQLVHSCHATYHASRCYRPDEGIPCLVVIGVPDLAALNRVLTKLRDKQVPHFAWTDPDVALGMLSIATAPLTDDQRIHLKNYRLYSPGAPKGACLLTEDGGAKADLAQLREHSVSNGEVVGGNPAVGSTSQ
jgi:hypothetical protein